MIFFHSLFYYMVVYKFLKMWLLVDSLELSFDCQYLKIESKEFYE